MAKTISVTCDGCGRHIENENYQTLTIRRYTGEKHQNTVKIPTLWMCDKCYRNLMIPMVCKTQEGGE